MRWHSKTHGTKPVHTHTAVAVHAAEVVDLWRAIDRCKHVWVGFGLSSAGGGLKINLHAFAVAPVLHATCPTSQHLDSSSSDTPPCWASRPSL